MAKIGKKQSVTPPPVAVAEADEFNFESIDDTDESAEVTQEELQSEVESTRKLPPVEGKTLKWDEMEKWAAQLTPEHWNHICVYLYRQFPIILRPKPFNIDKITRPEDLTLDYIKRVHGGGRYKLLFCDMDRKQTKMFAVYVEIPWFEVEPKINLGELILEEPANRTYVNKLKAEGVLDNGGNVIPKEEPKSEMQVVVATLQKIIDRLMSEKDRPQDKNSTQEALAQSMGMLGKAYDTAIQTAIKNNAVDDVDKLTKLMTQVKEMLPKPTSGESTSDLYKLIIQQQSDNAKNQIELMKQLLTKPESEDPVSRMDGILGIMAKLTDFIGKGGKSSTLDTVLEHATGIISPIANVLQAYFSSRSGGMGARPSGPVASVTSPVAIAAGQPATGGEPMNINPDAFLAEFGPKVLDYMNQGRTGDELAENLAEYHGMNVYNIIHSLGEDQILALCKMKPDFWAQIQPIEVKFREFVQQFLSYPELLKQAELEEQVTEGVANISTASAADAVKNVGKKKGKVQ